MGLRALLAKSASAVLPLHRRRRRASLSAFETPPPAPSAVPILPRESSITRASLGRRNSLPSRCSDEHGDATDSDDEEEDNGDAVAVIMAAHASARTPTAAARGGGKTPTMAARAARLSATAAARITRLVGENPPMGSSARVVRRQYQSIVKERELAAADDDADRVDAVALYEVEFPKQPTHHHHHHYHRSASAAENTASPEANYPLGIDLETDFYGKHTVVKEVKRGSVAYALSKAKGARVLKPGHCVVAVNGVDLTSLAFPDVLQALKTASAPRVIRFLDPQVLPFSEYRHEPSLVNRDQYGFAKDDRYILNYRRQVRKRKLAGYEHELRWAEFVQQRGGIDCIDSLLHDPSLDPSAQTARATVLSELRELVLKGIPAVMRPRVWGMLTGATPYRKSYPADYYTQLVSQIESSASIGDIEKDINRTYPEHVFFQSDQGRRELKHVLGAYSLHNPHIGYCQSMNFIAGMMILLTNEEDAFWLFCALMEKRYLPAENYTQSMVGTQTDQLVFKELVNQELPVLAERLTFCGIQIQLVTLHWFLCAFVCTLPTESALRVWDWFCLDGQEVLFITAIGILKHAEPRIMGATLHSDLHTIVRELGTDLHDDDAFMEFLYALAPPSEIERREAGKMFDQVWECDNESSGGSSSSDCVDESDNGGDQAREEEPLDEEELPGSVHPPVAWASTASSPVKSRLRKRAMPAMSTKLHNMLQHLMESHRKPPNAAPMKSKGRSTRAASYQKQFTLQDIETLRCIYRPQFEKKVTAAPS